VKVSYFHRNSYLAIEMNKALERNTFYLYFYYSSLVVEKRVETLVYDIGGFLAAAGGNMGLMLGLSFLTILFSAIDWTKATLQLCAKMFQDKYYKSTQTTVEKY
jgi:hypothetical protein